jgi:YggT family protein
MSLFATGNMLLALEYLFRFVYFMILIRIVMSWIQISPYSRFGQFVYGATEPILGPTRHLIHSVFGYTGFIDFSPIAAILIIRIIYSVLARIIILI